MAMNSALNAAHEPPMHTDIVPSLRPEPFDYFDQRRQVNRAFALACERIDVLHDERAQATSDRTFRDRHC
jgi:hypothetical protein